MQTARENPNPFTGWMNYTPLSTPDCKLYDAMREGVPIIDAAIDKIIRLVGSFAVTSSQPRYQRELNEFIDNVQVGACSYGLKQFISCYLDSLLTYGNAVGEIIPSIAGDNIDALYNAKINDIAVKRGKHPMQADICTITQNGNAKPVAYPQLILFTPLSPPSGEIKGVSLLRSLPFVSEVLMKIFASIGTNFDRVANLRYAVTYNPGNSGVDKLHAREIASTIADQWADAMNSAKAGVIKDFVAVGDVGIKVIGADNQMLDTEVPVRQMLEQIVAKLGIPPFMLGLHWSSTERMSAQQADILTSELESYRRLLENVIKRICNYWMLLHGYGATVGVEWDDINLQDQVEMANARLLQAQANRLEQEGGQENKPETIYH